jgi:hypothetical protein
MGDGLELKVQFTQTFTIRPPDRIQDEYDATFSSKMSFKTHFGT